MVLIQLLVKGGSYQMAGEGQMLRAAREEKQWSLAYTEEITKIRILYIQALEEEKYQILPGETYTKGYLRTYAKQLGLDPDEILALYKSSATSEPIFVPELPNQPVKPRPFWVKPVLLGSISVFIIVLVIALALSKSGKELVDPPYVPAVLPSAPQTEKTKPSGPVVPDPAVAPTQEDLTMQMVFTQDCWMEIKIDEQSPFQTLFRAGTTKELKGKSKIELVTIGNAAGFTATLNGKQLPSYEDGGKVVNNVVLTQDTLKSL